MTNEYIRKEVLKTSLTYFNGDELAATAWVNKYCLKDGDIYYELTPDDMHKRMAKEFAKTEYKYLESPTGNFNNEKLSEYGKKRAQLNEIKIYNLFKDFKYIIPQGSVMSQLGAPWFGSLSNCFVIGQPEDSYGGIFHKEQEMVQLMKNRGGVGIDLSTLRPAGTATTNAAKTSTGAVSFMHRFSNSTNEVAQNGRRGALMISMDINHPDILDFIKIKRDLTKVTGANISIKLNNKFMKAVENDEDYILRFPCDIGIVSGSTDTIPYNELQKNPMGNTYYKKIKAKDIWNEIIKSAHNVAEPGLMFWDNMVNYSPDGVYKQFKQITTNPCSEIAMQEYDACRLIAVNLFSFVDNPFTENAKFDFDKYYRINYEAMRLSDDLIDLEIERINEIINKIEKDKEIPTTKLTELNLWIKVRETALASRRTGLGFTGLGDTLAALGLKYDSEEALKTVELIGKTKFKSELDCSIDLAVIRGTFKGWDNLTEYTNDFKTKGKNSFYTFIGREFPEQYSRMALYGRRNVSWSTVAPTGTVSLMAQVTSGIEPLFQPFYTRRVKGGTDFIDQNGVGWTEYAVLHPKFKDWLITLGYPTDRIKSMDKNTLQIHFEKSPWYKATANDIDRNKRVELQSIIQKYISHSISSTINLPEDVLEKEVSNIYMESWKKGLKGITVYRDGSRSGVLVTNTNKEEFDYIDAKKRPKELDGESHTISVQGEKYTVMIGFMDNKPYEVFAYKGDGINGKGKIVKKKRGHYVFVNGKEIDITDNLDDEQEAITRGYSWGLRHGGNIKFAVEQLQKTKKGELFSFSRALARVLKKYIPDGSKSTILCQNPECTGDRTNVIFEEGCNKCLDCGSGKCG